VAQHKRRSLAVLISDLYDPAGFEKGSACSTLQQSSILRGPRRRPVENAKLFGGGVLLDWNRRGPERLRSRSTAKVLTTAREIHREYTQEIERFCATRQVPYTRADEHPVRRAHFSASLAREF
jgi:hypothetical protein